MLRLGANRNGDRATWTCTAIGPGYTSPPDRVDRALSRSQALLERAHRAPGSLLGDPGAGRRAGQPRRAWTERELHD